jgi:hypothetical protein
MKSAIMKTCTEYYGNMKEERKHEKEQKPNKLF